MKHHAIRGHICKRLDDKNMASIKTKYWSDWTSMHEELASGELGKLVGARLKGVCAAQVLPSSRSPVHCARGLDCLPFFASPSLIQPGLSLLQLAILKSAARVSSFSSGNQHVSI